MNLAELDIHALLLAFLPQSVVLHPAVVYLTLFANYSSQKFC